MPAQRIILRADPEYQPEDGDMEFRLTYQGILMGASRNSTRAKHKHELRRVFHKQLQRYWHIYPLRKQRATTSSKVVHSVGFISRLPLSWPNSTTVGYNWVPLVSVNLSLICAIDILFLRPSMPGELMRSGDIDARLNTIRCASYASKQG